MIWNRAAICAAVALAVFGQAAVASATPSSTPPSVPLVTSPIPDVFGDLADAQKAVSELQAAVVVADAAVVAAQTRIGVLEADAARAHTASDAAHLLVAEAEAALTAMSDTEQAAAERLMSARDDVSAVAARSYVSGGNTDRLGVLLEADSAGDLEERRVIMAFVADTQLGIVTEYGYASEAASAEVVAQVAELAATVAAARDADDAVVAADVLVDVAVAGVEAARSAREAAVAAVVTAEALVVTATNVILALGEVDLLTGMPVGTDSSGLVASGVVPDTDLPVVALAAYQRAALFGRSQFEGCDLDWFEVAGIGKQESGHGRYRGSVPTLTGLVVPPILGIALDGTRSMAIRDTDAGLMDGDIVWDRAVGPTQFIPSTWAWYSARWDLDGSGDGYEDPQNIYDAARATAVFLCRNGFPMVSEQDRSRGLWAYNPNRTYNRLVLGWMAGYAAMLVPDLTGMGIPQPTSAPVGPVISIPEETVPTDTLVPETTIGPSAPTIPTMSTIAPVDVPATVTPPVVVPLPTEPVPASTAPASTAPSATTTPGPTPGPAPVTTVVVPEPTIVTATPSG